MFSVLKKYTVGFPIPVLILIVAAVAAGQDAELPPLGKAMLPFFPWLAAAVGGVMGWRFNRSRITFSLVVIATVHGVMIAFFQAPPGKDVLGQVVYAAAAVLLPLNIAVMAFLEERGVLTLHGMIRAGVLVAQGVAVYLIAHSGIAVAAGQMLHVRLLPPEFDQWTYLPQPAMFAFILAFSILIARWVLNKSGLEGASVTALLASAIAMHAVARGLTPDIFFIGATLILTVAVVQDAYRMAFHDELTGLPGRRALTDGMKKLPGRYAIAMLDVDHFKKFNDTYGHDAGDQVLQMMAYRLGEIGGGGRAYRYGGEEFTILYPGKDLEDAWDYLQELCDTISGTEFALRAKDRPKKKPKKLKRGPKPKVVKVTISIGVADFEDADTPEEVLREADKALYRAKKAGRNQVSD
ncbi:MAG: GGDEF domain-containing protein [Rhodospirillales bacterium]|nr:GGDEF domain-containing protein [Rhodospirillales bacterium]